MARISINIVTWNGLRFLPEALETIYNQTYKDFNIIIVDNGSTDGTVEYVKNNFPDITMLRNVRNLGFAHGHNQAIRMALNRWSEEEMKDHFVLVTNQDILLNPDFLENIVKEADEHTGAASFGGKLFKAFTNASDDEMNENVKSDILDSTGLKIFRSRRVVDRGAGERDQGQYDNERDVFGISGAILLLRASALADVRYGDEFFDADFFSYKEDVDLAWRLRLRGWESRYVPEAVAYHYRGAYSPMRSSWYDTLKSRRKRSRLVNFYSFTNHYFLFIKNCYFKNCLIHLPWIFFYEFKKLLFTFFLEPWTFWPGLRRILLNFSKMTKKRKYNLSRARTMAGEMRKWLR